METSVGAQPGDPVRVERYPTEIPLRILIALVSLGLWFALALSIVGAVYAAFIGLALMTAHVAAIAHVRGSAVRLSPGQFPELHARVREIGFRAGISQEPEAYVMQAGGVLNAFATKFLRSHILVLFSELLDACDGDPAARDMVIAHEIGHIRCGHLKWRWLLVPGLFVPFLGTAYSRACEYTCDRYGAALCGDRVGALRGLAILAAGGKRGREVNLEALAAQRKQLDTGFMTIGTWLSTHPPLAARIAALDPQLDVATRPGTSGVLRALGILVFVALIPMAGSAFAFYKFFQIVQRQQQEVLRQASARNAPIERAREPLPAREVPFARDQVQKDFAALASLVEEFHARHGRFPQNTDGLYNAWEERHPGERVPHDPFDGQLYGYATDGTTIWLWSSGPDATGDTDDDIELRRP